MQEGDRGESDSREGGRDKGTGDERSRCDRRKDEWKKGSESRCDQTEVNNKDDAKQRSYSEAVIKGGIKNRKGIYVRLHFAKDRQDIKQRRRRCCLFSRG